MLRLLFFLPLSILSIIIVFSTCTVARLDNNDNNTLRHYNIPTNKAEHCCFCYFILIAKIPYGWRGRFTDWNQSMWLAVTYVGQHAPDSANTTNHQYHYNNTTRETPHRSIPMPTWQIRTPPTHRRDTLIIYAKYWVPYQHRQVGNNDSTYILHKVYLTNKKKQSALGQRLRLFGFLSYSREQKKKEQHSLTWQFAWSRGRWTFVKTLLSTLKTRHFLCASSHWLLPAGATNTHRAQSSSPRNNVLTPMQPTTLPISIVRS